jgi:hypothetical protein
VSQQPLQGFDLAPPAFFRRLHDTHLEPTHIPPRGLRVNGSPCQLRARDRTNQFSLSSSALPRKSVMQVFSWERPERSPPAFAASNENAGIRSITERHLLPLSSAARISIGRLAASFPRGKKYGFTLFR